MAALALAAACVPVAPPPPDQEPPVTVSMAAGWADGFFSLPWPNEIRKRPDGTLDLAGLPVRGSLLLASLAESAGREVSDFGTNSAAYLRFSGPIDPSSLPGPEASASPGSPLQLVALDGSEERVPVVTRVEPADGYRTTNLVSLLPYPGHGLRPDTRYMVIVTRGIRSADGTPAVPAPLIDALDQPFAHGTARSSAHWDALRNQRDEARALLDATGVWQEDDLVGFSAYRTQDSTALMAAVAAAVDSTEVQVPRLDPVGRCDPASGRRTFSGRLAVPRFQLGRTTTTFGGGRIDVDATGRAVVQYVETTAVGVSVPCGPAPEQGWAVQTYIDGSGAGARPSGGFGRLASDTVIGSVAPLYSPDETGPLYNPLLFYNFANPAAARTNPLQQAADNLVLLRMLAALELPGELLDSPSPVTTDDSTVVVTGHSQGAQSVALVAASAPEVDAIVTSAATSGQYNSVSYRSDVRDIVGLLVGSRFGLDPRSPVVQVVQTLLDVAEPANFPTTGHWLNFAGRDDGCLTLEASRHLAGSQRLAVVTPQWPSLFGAVPLDAPVLTAPVSGNGADGTTRVSVEVDGGHRVASGNMEMAGRFIDDVVAGVTPTVPAPPYGVGPPDSCPARFGPIGNHL